MATPNHPTHQPSQALSGRPSLDRDGAGLQPGINGASRNLSASAAAYAHRGGGGGSFNPSIGPGSFSSELRSQTMLNSAGRLNTGSVYPTSVMDKVDEDDDDQGTAQALASLKDRL